MFPATTTNATDTRCNGGKQREIERVGNNSEGRGERIERR